MNLIKTLISRALLCAILVASVADHLWEPTAEVQAIQRVGVFLVVFLVIVRTVFCSVAPFMYLEVKEDPTSVTSQMRLRQAGHRPALKMVSTLLISLCFVAFDHPWIGSIWLIQGLWFALCSSMIADVGKALLVKESQSC